MAMLKCTINGKSLEVPQGTTIIEAYKMAGLDIAHYCWHPALSIAGVCRMCMVKIEGNPRLQIACNTQVTEGMIVNNTDQAVKEAVEWTLKFHLINHPLDCPICDQAGECGLQEYYMKHGKYDSLMGSRKVKKRKVVSLGETVMLDSERCILCSRCVRFTEEVTKTNELGIFNRGDRSEVGTFEDRPLNNKYSVNVVDICPVGALTSKDFRFRQRVWFLKDVDTVCNGCSTGCNIKVYYNENGLYRVKPIVNKEVNGHWMCDEGRDIYKFANHEVRQTQSVTPFGELAPGAAAQKAGLVLKETVAEHGPNSVAVVFTAQYTTEEYETAIQTLKGELGVTRFYHWINNAKTFDEYDGLLIRGDKNPNTFGLIRLLEQHKIKSTWSDLESAISKSEIKLLVVVGPEIQSVYPDLKEKVELFKKAGKVVYLTSGKNEIFADFTFVIPMKSFIEKEGSFENHKGIKQKIRRGPVIVPSALTLKEAVTLIAGKPMTIEASMLSMHGGI